MKRVQDHYFKKAKREGYAARSAYKLEEIDRRARERLLRPGMRVLDLGCAPGSWLQYAAGRVGARGLVLGIDLEAVTIPLPPQARAIRGDVFAIAPETLVRLLAEPHPFTPIRFAQDRPGGMTPRPASPSAGSGQAPEGQGEGFDLILSDMAPKTTGVPSGDAARSAALALRALELAQAEVAGNQTLLRAGGALLVKVFQGASFPELRRAFREHFERVTIEKPKASRAESVELFLLGEGFRPHPPAPSPKGEGESAA